MKLFTNNFFGFRATEKNTTPNVELKTFDVEKTPGAENFSELNVGGILSYNYDAAQVPSDEIDLIKTFRRLALSPEIDLALNEIQNEVFVFDVTNRKAVSLDFISEDNEISSALKKKIVDEFNTIYNLLNFKNKGLSLFMDWFIDGRLILHKIIDTNNPKNGIQKIIEIDPTKIKKIIEYPEPDRNGIYDISKIQEYYIFTNRPDIGNQKNNLTSYASNGLRINPDAITFADCGIVDRTSNKILGFLYKAIVPFNNLKLLEDSVIIYRVTRAPERRVFYIDVGNLPKTKAEQYVKDLMGKFKTKLVYDSQTGSLSDKKNIMSMIEDIWLPRRDGKGTEIDTLPPGGNLGEMNDVEHFKTKLYQSLNVPLNRFSEQAPSFMFGKGVEIYREEYRFKKFIDKIRNRFMFIFEDLLKTQLILKKIITPEDWDEIRDSIQWVFAEDNNFVEFKESEIITNRLGILATMEPFIGPGKYFSHEWVMKNVLKFNDEEIEKVVADQKKNPPVVDPDE